MTRFFLMTGSYGNSEYGDDQYLFPLIYYTGLGRLRIEMAEIAGTAAPGVYQWKATRNLLRKHDLSALWENGQESDSDI